MQLRTYSNIVEQKMDNNRTKNFWRDQLSGDVWRKLGTKCQAMRHTLSWSSVTCYAENPAAFAAENLNSPHHSQTPISFHREAQTQQPAPQRTQAAFITKSTNSQHGLRQGEDAAVPTPKRNYYCASLGPGLPSPFHPEHTQLQSHSCSTCSHSPHPGSKSGLCAPALQTPALWLLHTCPHLKNQS